MMFRILFWGLMAGLWADIISERYGYWWGVVPLLLIPTVAVYLMSRVDDQELADE